MKHVTTKALSILLALSIVPACSLSADDSDWGDEEDTAFSENASDNCNSLILTATKTTTTCSVVRDLTLQDGFSNAAGLNSITSVYGTVTVTGTALTTVKLPPFTGINGRIVVENNPFLSTLDIQTTTQLEDLIIEDNPAFARIVAPSLLGTNNDFVIRNNDNMRTLVGFESVVSIQNDLMIEDNMSLRTLDGLNSLRIVGGNVSVSGNDSLWYLESPNTYFTNGLGALEAINGTLSVTSNAALYNCAMPSLRSVSHFSATAPATSPGTVIIHDNPNLPSVQVASLATQVGAINDTSYIYNNRP